MGEPLFLNGFQVDPTLAQLMRRGDWQRKRTETAWLAAFAAHPDSDGMPFVEFCGPEWAQRENAGIRDPELAILRGRQSTDFPPGDFDPEAGYLIGFTDLSDSAIVVDLRPPSGARI